MRCSLLSLVALASLVSQAYASTIAPRTIRELLVRQTGFDPSVIPASCNSRCSGIVSTLNTCASSTSSSCGCSTKDEGDFVDCLNCIMYSSGVTPSASQIQSVQSYVDQYVTFCNSVGVSLPATTLSGGVTQVTSTRGGNSPVSATSPASATGAFTSGTAAVTSVRPGASSTPPVISGDDETTSSRPNQQTVTGPATPTDAPTGLTGQNSALSVRGQTMAGFAAAFSVVFVVFF